MKKKAIAQICRFIYSIFAIGFVAAILVGTPAEIPQLLPPLLLKKGSLGKVSSICAQDFKEEIAYIGGKIFPNCKKYLESKEECTEGHLLYAKAFYLYAYSFKKLNVTRAIELNEEALWALKKCPTVKVPLRERAQNFLVELQRLKEKLPSR